MLVSHLILDARTSLGPRTRSSIIVASIIVAFVVAFAIVAFVVAFAIAAIAATCAILHRIISWAGERQSARTKMMLPKSAIHCMQPHLAATDLWVREQRKVETAIKSVGQLANLRLIEEAVAFLCDALPGLIVGIAHREKEQPLRLRLRGPQKGLKPQRLAALVAAAA